jgi:hypothetical protein
VFSAAPKRGGTGWHFKSIVSIVLASSSVSQGAAALMRSTRLLPAKAAAVADMFLGLLMTHCGHRVCIAAPECAGEQPEGNAIRAAVEPLWWRSSAMRGDPMAVSRMLLRKRRIDKRIFVLGVADDQSLLPIPLADDEVETPDHGID